MAWLPSEKGRHYAAADEALDRAGHRPGRAGGLHGDVVEDRRGGHRLAAYTGATILGSASLDETSEGRFPLPPGKYTAMLLVDDAYEAVATEDFVIR